MAVFHTREALQIGLIRRVVAGRAYGPNSETDQSYVARSPRALKYHFVDSSTFWENGVQDVHYHGGSERSGAVSETPVRAGTPRATWLRTTIFSHYAYPNICPHT